MKNLWDDRQAAKIGKNPLDLRTYTSNLIGQSHNLVLHGGGNTSVKVREKDFFGKETDFLYVKGSGWDLASIKPEGFSAVKMDVLMQLASLSTLSDTDMVREQKAAMKDPTSPSPSVEAILHAVIPHTFVDHTHADAVVTLTNCLGDMTKLKEIFGDRILFIPYVMPGFVLARKVFELTRDIEWSDYDGMILMNHGVFSFADSAKDSYDRMIDIVSRAEEYLSKEKFEVREVGEFSFQVKKFSDEELLRITELRKTLSEKRGKAVVCQSMQSEKIEEFYNLKNVSDIAIRGPLTPDHSIHTKPWPMIFNGQVSKDTDQFSRDYKRYFDKNRKPDLTMLDDCPRWVVWPKKSVFAVADNSKKLKVIADIAKHTIETMNNSEKIGGWKGLPQADLFDVEYWELEQAKLKKTGKAPEFEGRVVVVTGAASGIGYAIAEDMRANGACVSAWDINPEVEEQFNSHNSIGLQVDVRDHDSMAAALSTTIQRFGGVDILILNAGIFPSADKIESLGDEVWDNCIQINLTSCQRLLKAATPFLKNGIEPSVLFVGSKNVYAPGPGASAYSVAKAGVTQLARVAAFELGADGIPVNVIHPNAVFDTGIWTDSVLATRAKHYGLSVEEYKKNNVLKTEVTSKDVATLARTMVSSVFSKTTGAQVPIDGGNDRVI